MAVHKIKTHRCGIVGKRRKQLETNRHARVHAHTKKCNAHTHGRTNARKNARTNKHNWPLAKRRKQLEVLGDLF
jgi:hypothetical protein